MKNVKTKIRTLLVAIMLATLCSSFIVTNFAYAVTAAEQKLIDAQAAQKKADEAAKGKTLTNAQKKANEATKKAQAAVAAEQKAAQIEADKKAAAEKAAADAKCIKDSGGLTCAEIQQSKDIEKQNAQKAITDPTFNLTEGTFSVTTNLTLDNGDQAKKYFSKDPNAPSPIVALVLTFINFAITIMGSIAVILLIVAGFMFMTAQGNSQKLDEAKDIIKYAAIGLLVALLSYVITIFVQSIFSNG
jgi:hypothetical protein